MSGHFMQSFFEPASVAIVGASSDGDKLGGRPQRFMTEAGYAGRIVPVNPRATQIQGLEAAASIDAIDGPVEQAIVVVPAAGVLDAIHACGRKGIRAVQILTSGFAEMGPAGAAEQQRLVEAARGYRMRLLGPNCLGLVSVHNRYFATFSTALDAMTPLDGCIGMVTQSGAFGSCAYATATQRGIGLSRIVATGNEADVDVADCIDYMVTDPRTAVICVAIEGCRDGDHLRQALAGAARAGKPVVMMKVGSTAVGAAAAATHTGALAGDDQVFATVFAECGAYRARTIEEMLDVALLCATSPLPPNRRAGVVSLSGGIGVLMADACEAAGLELPALPEAAAAPIRAIVPFATLGNPLDTTAQVAAVPDGLCRVLEAMLDQTDWGTVFVYLAQKAAAPRRFDATLRLLQSIRARHPQRCIVLVGPSDEGVRRALEAAALPMVTDPSRAVHAAAAAAHIAARRQQLHAPLPAPAEGAEPLAVPADERAAKALLASHGLPFLQEVFCTDEAGVVAAARAAGFPVALKIVSPDIAHKTEAGGVLLGLADAEAVGTGYRKLMDRVRAAAPAARLEGVLVAPMVRDGLETILGVHRDPVFGLMAMFGLGGTAAELFRDVAFATVPLTAERAQAMVDGVRCAPLLRGWRGTPTLDEQAIVDALMALSAFAERHRADIGGVEINPFIARVRGGVGLDALVVPRAAEAGGMG